MTGGRSDWMDGIDQLQRDGVIDADDQNALIRHLNEHRQELGAQLRRLVPEYEERVASDGQASADEWLAATARALGERDGAKARQLVDSLPAVKNAPVSQ